MTLPSSGPLNFIQIQREIDGVGQVPFTIPNAQWRKLAGKPTGSLVIPNDFWGKTSDDEDDPGPLPDPEKTFDLTGSDTHTIGTASQITFTGVGLGTAATGRRILVAVHWSEGGIHQELTSLTIGGVSATIHVQRGHTGGSTGLGVALASAVVASGTSASIVATFEGAVANGHVRAYRMMHYENSPTDTDSDEQTGSTASLSATLTTGGKATIVGAYTGSTNTAGNAIAWTGATEQYDIGTSTIEVRCGGAYATDIQVGSQAISATQGVILNSGNDLVALTWS
jgi:hypothetical protein